MKFLIMLGLLFVACNKQPDTIREYYQGQQVVFTDPFWVNCTGTVLNYQLQYSGRYMYLTERKCYYQDDGVFVFSITEQWVYDRDIKSK